MRSSRTFTGLVLLAGIAVSAGDALGRASAQGSSGTSTLRNKNWGDNLPGDINRISGSRIPPAKTEDLDEDGKRIQASRPDKFGPTAMRLHNPQLAAARQRLTALRKDFGIEPRLLELAILVVGREMDCDIVWTSHEIDARNAGLAQDIIDVVKYRRPVTGLGEQEAVIVRMGRDSLLKHSVDSQTFALAAKHFGYGGIVNIASLMGDYAGQCMLAHIGDQYLRPGLKSTMPLP